MDIPRLRRHIREGITLRRIYERYERQQRRRQLTDFNMRACTCGSNECAENRDGSTKSARYYTDWLVTIPRFFYGRTEDVAAWALSDHELDNRVEYVKLVSGASVSFAGLQLKQLFALRDSLQISDLPQIGETVRIFTAVDGRTKSDQFAELRFINFVGETSSVGSYYQAVLRFYYEDGSLAYFHKLQAQRFLVNYFDTATSGGVDFHLIKKLVVIQGDDPTAFVVKERRVLF